MGVVRLLIVLLCEMFVLFMAMKLQRRFGLMATEIRMPRYFCNIYYFIWKLYPLTYADPKWVATKVVTSVVVAFAVLVFQSLISYEQTARSILHYRCMCFHLMIPIVFITHDTTTQALMFFVLFMIHYISLSTLINC